jgi:hypothetical protein
MVLMRGEPGYLRVTATKDEAIYYGVRPAIAMDTSISYGMGSFAQHKSHYAFACFPREYDVLSKAMHTFLWQQTHR